MKKMFLTMLGVCAMLCSTSCSDEEIVVSGEGEAMVQLTVALNDGSDASRAISDGTTVDKVYYEVFSNITKDGVVTQTEVETLKGEAEIKEKQATVQLALVKGQTYDIVFWASKENVYNTEDLTKIAVNAGLANDETKDAFTAKRTYTVTGPIKETIKLTRPFAQINFGTLLTDMENAEKAGAKLVDSKIQVTNLAHTYNALTEEGVVDEGAEPQTVEFAYYAIPDTATQELTLKNSATTYEYLATAYVLFPGKADAQVTTDLTMTVPTGLNQDVVLTVPNAPAQRNFRTNVLGNLLTNQAEFNIVVDPIYAGESNFNTPFAMIGKVAYISFADAMAAVQDGETITLVGNTELLVNANEHLFTIDGKNITIDLNGNGLVANIPDVTTNTAVFHVKKNSGLTIVGEGDVHLTTAKAVNVLAAFINNDGGTVNLKGGNWTMTALNDWQESLIPCFVDNNSNLNSATLNIYDGTYTFNRNLFRNFANAAGHNNYATVATINIYGGTFNGYEGDAGAIWNQKPSTSTPKGAGIINVIGGTFNNVTISDDFAETASVIVPENNTEDVVLSTETVKVTVPASAAQAGDDYKVELRNESSETNSTTGETTVSFDLTMYKNNEKVSGGNAIYEVVWNIGAGKILSGVTHNGTALAKAETGADQTYTYDSATGDLTIYTKSFSPFAITYADYKDYVRTKNFFYGGYISVSTGSDLLPIVAVNPEITKYSVFDGDTRITDAITFRFSEVKKETINENSYKVSVNLAILDDKGNDLVLKPGMPSTINGKEYLNVYMNLIEVPAGYSISEVKVGGTTLSLTANQSGNTATGEYWVGSDTKDVYFQSKTAGLIEVTLTK